MDSSKYLRKKNIRTCTLIFFDLVWNVFVGVGWGIYLTTNFFSLSFVLFVFRGSFIRRTLNSIVWFENHNLLFTRSFNLSKHVVKWFFLLLFYFPSFSLALFLSLRMAFYVSHSIKSVWNQNQLYRLSFFKILLSR